MEENNIVVPSPQPSSFSPDGSVTDALRNTTPELMAGDIVGNVMSKFVAGSSGQPSVEVQVPQPAPQADPEPQAPVQAVPQAMPNIADRFAAPDPDAKPVVPDLPEVPQEQVIPEPQNMADSAHHAFAAARAQTKQFRDLAEKYRQEVEGVRKQYEDYSKRENALAEQLTAEQKKTHDLEEEIGKLDLSRSPSFRQQYDAPLQAKQDEIAKVLVDNGMQQADAARVSEDIMMAASDQVPSLVSQLPTVAQGMIMVKHNEASQLWAGRSQALEDWRTTSAGLSEVSAREGAVVNAQRRADLANTAFERIGGIDTMRWDSPDIVSRRGDAIEKAKAWYQTAPDDQIAAAAMEGVLAPFAYERVGQLEAEVSQLRQQLDASSRMRNPTVAPFFQSVPLQAPPPPQRPQAPGTVPGQPWATPVDGATSPTSVAEDMVRRVFGQ